MGVAQRPIKRDKFGRRYVYGSGPTDTLLMGVGEAPGYTEDRFGRPFVGKTGIEMGRLLQEANISMASMYLTNVVKYRPFSDKATGNSAPDIADIERDRSDLIDELYKVQPHYVAAIGRIAARWFLGDVDLDDVRGFAWPTVICGECEQARKLTGDALISQTVVAKMTNKLGTSYTSPCCGVKKSLLVRVVPVTHPAAGFHQPEQQPNIYWDFQRFGQIVGEKISGLPPVDEYPDPDYYHIKGGGRIVPKNSVIGVDTEGVKGDVWSVQMSLTPGSAGILLVEDKKAMEYLKKVAIGSGNTLLLHNAPWDLQRLAEALRTPLVDLMAGIKFEDTMQKAYVTRLLPKGLKALGRRFKGVEMESYLSVVEEADRRIMLEYFKSVLKKRCVKCNGAGTVIEQPVSPKTGKLLGERLVNCTDCEGDGTGWVPPDESMEYKKGKLSISRGRRMGWRVRNFIGAAERVDPKTGRLVDLSKQYANMRKKQYEFVLQVEDEIGPPRAVTLRDVPFEKAKHYACRDADVTKRIDPDLDAEMDREGLRGVYEMDRAVIPMITQMMNVGWKIDVPFLNTLTKKLEIQQDKLLYRLEELVGRPINPNSPIQVRELLFDEWGLHPFKQTATGDDSTDNKVLADLRIYCAVKMDNDKRYRKMYDGITLMMEHKERGKLKSTYTLPLPRQVDKFSRLHTDIKIASVESGRLASAAPNLQNISNRTELGKSIRKAFICDPGHVLVGVDLSQIEMRVLAHLAGEKRLIKAIKEGLDVHALTCSKIFNIPIEKVTKSMWQRDASKTLGFGIVYGISAPALKTQIKLQSSKHTPGGVDVPVEQCEEWIDYYRTKAFPAIGDFMDDSEAYARRYGYVESMFKRRRYLPGVHSPIGGVRAEAERIATNHRIQGTASDLEKMAMRTIWEEVLPKYRKRGYTECLLQEHDALFFETETRLAEGLLADVIKVKRNIVKLRVPLDADGKVGPNWAALK